MFKDFTRVTRREDAPELPKLPVYQEIYCSQGITDALCDYVMEHAPWDTVLWQIYAEDEPDDRILSRCLKSYQLSMRIPDFYRNFSTGNNATSKAAQMIACFMPVLSVWVAPLVFQRCHAYQN